MHADVGLREGLPIQAAYVHDLKGADREPVDVTAAAIANARQTAEASAESPMRSQILCLTAFLARHCCARRSPPSAVPATTIRKSWPPLPPN